MNARPEALANPARRKQIMDASREIAAKQGWAAVTVRAVGARIGCSAPAIYQYFHDKDEILAALADYGIIQLEALLDKAAASTGGSAKRVRAMVQTLWDFAFEHRELYLVIYGGEGLPARGKGPTPDSMARSVAKLSAKRGGGGPSADLADRLAATVHGFIGLTLAGCFPGGRARAQRLCEQMIDDMIRGIGRH